MTRSDGDLQNFRLSQEQSTLQTSACHDVNRRVVTGKCVSSGFLIFDGSLLLRRTLMSGDPSLKAIINVSLIPSGRDDV